MKKVGILTFHFSDNYGAVLQCFALRKVINKMVDCEAEIINYNPGKKPGWYTETDIQEMFQKKLKAFADFNREINEIHGDEFDTISEELANDKDIFIVGSDQVWNVSFNFFRETYFLNFTNKIKASYAASIGLPVERIGEKKALFERYLNQFDYISVREKSHLKFVEECAHKKASYVLDPTLLLKREDYDEIAITDELSQKDDYILFYYLKHDDRLPNACSFVNMVARKYNLRIYHFCVDMPHQIFKNPNESFYFEGPREFLALVRGAKIVITNSFHGTVFSLIYHKPFYTFVVDSMRARVVDLIEEVGLTNRLVEDYMEIDRVNMDIDFEKVDEKLKKMKDESMAYLYSVLNGV